MKTITEGKTSVKKIWGKQRLKDTKYRLMQYTLMTECGDGFLLLNTITGKMVLLDNEEVQFLRQLPSERTESMCQLIEDFFIVPIDYNEEETLNKLRMLINKVFTRKGITGYTILPTTYCNARCFYCYESSYEHISMTEETAHRVVEFIDKNRKDKSINISWFGGEPLVGIQRIRQICAELNERQVPFHSSMISNGYLFDPSVVEEAATDWKLKSVQITIDGTEEIYNRTKAYISATGSPYVRVLQNIECLLNNNIRVNVRLNLDQHNQSDLKDLISYLQKQFAEYVHFDMYVHVLYEDDGFAPIRRTDEARVELYKLQAELNSCIVQAGRGKYYVKLPSIKMHSCMADSDNSTVIYPDGRLYKCEHVVEGDELGDINNGIINENNIAKYKIGSKLSICKTCPLRPSCYILQQCEGIKERNSSTCKYEVDTKLLAMKKYYLYYKEKQENKVKKGHTQELDNCDV